MLLTTLHRSVLYIGTYLDIPSIDFLTRNQAEPQVRTFPFPLPKSAKITKIFASTF